MRSFWQTDAKTFAAEELDKQLPSQEISKNIKLRLEAKYGPTWHVVVGTEFRAAAGYQAKHMIFFPMGVAGRQAVLAYRTQ